MDVDSQTVETLIERLQTQLAVLTDISPRIGAAAVTLVATWIVMRLGRLTIGWLGPRVFRRAALVEVVGLAWGTVVWITGILVAAAVAFPSVTPANVLTTLGLGSIAIGFAFKDIFENFFAGFLILLREPFRIGDHVECGEHEGSVERITIRDTHVRKTDGQLVVMPNSDLFQNPVVVRTNREVRRAKVVCGVAYGADADRAREVIHDAVRALDSVRDDVRDVQVFACALSAYSVDFEIAWWTGSRPVDIRASTDEVVRAVKRALDREGIEIPFPQRVVTMREEGDRGG